MVFGAHIATNENNISDEELKKTLKYIPEDISSYKNSEPDGGTGGPGVCKWKNCIPPKGYLKKARRHNCRTGVILTRVYLLQADASTRRLPDNKSTIPIDLINVNDTYTLRAEIQNAHSGTCVFHLTIKSLDFDIETPGKNTLNKYYEIKPDRIEKKTIASVRLKGITPGYYSIAVGPNSLKHIDMNHDILTLQVEARKNGLTNKAIEVKKEKLDNKRITYPPIITGIFFILGGIFMKFISYASKDKELN